MPRRPVSQKTAKPLKAIRRVEPKAKARVNSSGKSSGRALVPQPHGGALLPGAGGGTQPGAGRPASAIRALLRGSAAERLKVLDEIADGEAVQKATIPLAAILPYVKCATCEDGGKVVPLDPESLAIVRIEGKVSALPKDRIASIGKMLEFGIGPDKELTTEAVRERLQRMLGVLKGELSPAVYARLEPQLKAAWTATT